MNESHKTNERSRDTASWVRQRFLSFFAQNLQHKVTKSANLIPVNDKSILFINSGMAPMKEFFLKQSVPPAQNIANIQKCVRAGGKHNDLDEVGYTERHHTFFEMCGNFSFGGYDGCVASKLALQFLTEELKIDKNRLWVTVHPADLEGYKAWLEVLPEERIKSIPENIWAMGDEGPCGMCAEIFYDHGTHLEGDFYNGNRFVELWNIVKMSNEVRNGVKAPLAQPCIDTGMGLERIVATLEGTHDNYKAGFFLKATKLIEKLSHQETNQHHRIIADHARTILFLAAEGIEAGNSGREYVMRRIIRRAALSQNRLGTEGLIEAAMHLASEEFKDTYPEVGTPTKAIKLLRHEIEQFKEACEHGLIQLQKLLECNPKMISGQDLFKLYDTYGLPIDIVSDQTRENNVNLDLAGFEECMIANKDRSRGQRAHHQSSCTSKFTGYDHLQIQTNVLDVKNDAILLEETPFYAEGGGQKGDKGIIYSDEWEFEVNDTQKCGESIWHYGGFNSGFAKLGDACTAAVDKERRIGCCQHHSATHLLLAALKLINPEINQKGSMVDSERLRFDFNYENTGFDIKAIEEQVNQWIQENHRVVAEYMQKDIAYQLGARGEFGEKYGEVVRILTMADSIEFCGGTHVQHTSEIGSFYIVKTSKVSANIVRIEAVAGQAAYKYNIRNREILRTLAQRFSTSIEGLANLKPNTNKGQNYEITSKKIADTNCSLIIYPEMPKSIVADIDKIVTDDNLAIALYANKGILVAMKTALDINISKLLNTMGIKAGGRSDFAQGGCKEMSKETFYINLEMALKALVNS